MLLIDHFFRKKQKAPELGPSRLHEPLLAQNTCGCGVLRAPPAVGPFLRFRNYDSEARIWTGSVLVVDQAESPPSLHYKIEPASAHMPPGAGYNLMSESEPGDRKGAAAADPPQSNGPRPSGTLPGTYRAAEAEGQTWDRDGGDAILLDEYQGWKFWRFDLLIEVDETNDLSVTYATGTLGAGSGPKDLHPSPKLEDQTEPASAVAAPPAGPESRNDNTGQAEALGPFLRPSVDLLEVELDTEGQLPADPVPALALSSTPEADAASLTPPMDTASVPQVPATVLPTLALGGENGKGAASKKDSPLMSSEPGSEVLDKAPPAPPPAPATLRKSHTFFIPAANKSWNWGFCSCNGFDCLTTPENQDKLWGGLSPLWRDVAQVHDSSPLALMVQGGDQLYNDDVFELPSLKAWLGIKDKKARLTEPFTDEMASQVETYYFHHYSTHFSAPHLAPILAGIPQICTWDDHDIFDGFGSYPFELQTCPVFNGIFAIAQRFYYLFQQSTNVSRASQDGLYDGKHMLVQAGPDVALMLPDQRSDRTRFQIVPPGGYMELFHAAYNKLPATVDQLVLISTVPVCYPHVLGSHGLAKTLKLLYRIPAVGRLSDKLGISPYIISAFDEPELLDDLRDHWSAPSHKEERAFLVQHLQLLARSRGMRVSILSGDVHMCGVGRLQSISVTAPKDDFRRMNQIISSAIGNAPPGTGAVRIQQWFSGWHRVTPTTYCRMTRLFKHKHRVRQCLLNRRNWCLVTGEGQGGLLFTLRVEEFKSKYKGPRLAPQSSPVSSHTDQEGKMVGSGGLSLSQAVGQGQGGGTVGTGGGRGTSGIPKMDTYSVRSPRVDKIKGRSKLEYTLFGAM